MHEKVREVGYFQEFVTRCTVNKIQNYAFITQISIVPVYFLFLFYIFLNSVFQNVIIKFIFIIILRKNPANAPMYANIMFQPSRGHP